MPAELRILFVTSEAHPLVKTGGLGDVGGALPPALRALGVDIRLMLPAYPGLIEQTQAKPLGSPLQALSSMLPVQLFQGVLPDTDTPVYLVDSPVLYHRNGPYVDENGKDWPDNLLRFGVFSRTAALFGSDGQVFGWTPQLIHCNDWQTGLTPAYLSVNSGRTAGSLLSIHNMAFQGNFPPLFLSQLELPKSSYSADGVEFHGQISFLKAGIYYADHISTVSPTYAREIQTAEFGYGLEGLLARRSGELTGILNGVDTTEWDPANDSLLPVRYARNRLSGKAVNKRALRERFGLDASENVPIVGIVSRLTKQKGIDLTLSVAERLLAEPMQLVVLGSGEKSFESQLMQLVSNLPGKVGVHIGYDEELAHLVEAGSDIFLMPSRFEPCGLNQMYSMLYGTPPVVRNTGGLADSVVDTTPSTLANDTATGFVFNGANSDELLACVLRALLLFDNKKAWRRLQISGMKRDFGWNRSAEQYLSLYQKLILGAAETLPTIP